MLQKMMMWSDDDLKDLFSQKTEALFVSGY
jgi:hypothetical protein